jgi:ADP-heptose:LPS heptosyltransferase
MHIANAVGTKVAVIFGPTMERITGPLGEGNIVLKGFDRPEWFPGTPSPAPEKCVRSLAAVTPEMAAEAVRKLLE